MTPSPSPSPSLRYWLRISLLLVLAMGLLALASRAVSAVMARLTLPTGGAEWIWVERSRTDRTPSAFYAVRDFNLDAPPAKARLMILADPEYILTLNGKRVGAGRYPTGAPEARLDVYEVGDLLLSGGNRVLVELRSDRGAGGLLAVIQDPEGKTLVRSDGEWRIVKRHHIGLVRGWLPLGPGSGLETEPAFRWGLPPTGRWGEPTVGALRPRLLELIRDQPLAATRVPAPRIPGLPATSARHLALFDFGREVTGYLNLQMQAGDGLRKALLYTGSEPPDPLVQRPAGAVLALTGRRSWMDAQPRRFRYALVVGDRPAAARVLPVDPKAADGLFADGNERKVEGVFGIDPPRLRTPVEDEVWRELQSVPGVGKDKNKKRPT